MKEKPKSIDNSIAQSTQTQSQTSPIIALKLLKDGNLRFLEDKTLHRDFAKQIKETATGQFPFAVVLSCIDSRIPTEIIFDQGVGDIFNIRIAGNFVNDDILGSLEFACKIAGAKVVLVMGHTSCGAIRGACDHTQLGHLTQLLEKLYPAVDSVETTKEVDRSSENLDFVNKVAHQNVNLSVAEILARSQVLSEMYNNDQIDIVGAMYDVANGKVEFFDSCK